MNYYERHLGDYSKDTAHLSILEHGVYSLLLDRYYGTEKGIPADQAHRIARARTKEEKSAVDAILAEFFHLDGVIFKNNRAEAEITKAQARISAARNNGGLGGRPKKAQEKTEEKPSGLSLGYEIETQSKAHHAPYTMHQSPDVNLKPKTQRASRFDALAHLCSLGIPDDLASDWLTLRKGKKAPATLTAIDGVVREAKKAGVTMQVALSMCCEMGWAGFKAEWAAKARANPMQSKEESRAAAYRGFMPPTEARSKNDDRTIDITPAAPFVLGS